MVIVMMIVLMITAVIEIRMAMMVALIIDCSSVGGDYRGDECEGGDGDGWMVAEILHYGYI